MTTQPLTKSDWDGHPVCEGQTFGKLTVLGRLFKEGGRWKYEVQCACGKRYFVPANNLTSGNSTKCRSCARAQAATKHGGHGSPTYSVWKSMRRRCASHPYYVEHAITVCSEWDDYEAFLRDMGERPSMAHTIDRIDGTQGYFPDNCRWATKRQQANNTMKNVFLDAFGESKTIAQWVRDARCNCCYVTLRRRIADGWPAEYAIREKPKPFKIRKQPCWKKDYEHASN